MKTKVLIEQLQKSDPTGELECCVGNGDIWGLEVKSSYWDGKLQVFQFNENNQPISAKRVSKGDKLDIRPIYISEVIGEYPGFVVEYESEEDRKRYEPIDIEAIRTFHQIELDCDRDEFVDWVYRKIQTIRTVSLGWTERIREAAHKFYDQQKMGPDNPFTKVTHGSYNDCRNEYFEDTFHVDWDEYSRIIIEVKPRSNEIDPANFGRNMYEDSDVQILPEGGKLNNHETK
jgi:hypothetical protein